MNRDYEIIATEAGYLVYVTDGDNRYPLGEQPYPSLIRARDQIPKRFRARARLVHATAYTEMINTPTDASPPLQLPFSSK
jgi:hypothetical protein